MQQPPELNAQDRRSDVDGFVKTNSKDGNEIKPSTAKTIDKHSTAVGARVQTIDEVARQRGQYKRKSLQNSTTDGLSMHPLDLRAEETQMPDLARLDTELRRRSIRRLPRSNERLAARRDREALGDLATFLRTVTPPPTNLMSIPDPASSSSGESSLKRTRSSKRRSGIKRAFGLLMRRGSAKKQKPAAKRQVAAGSAPARQPSTKKKTKKRPPQIKLPDSAVAGRTVGGFRHIAISIPIEYDHLSPQPRHHSQVRRKRSQSFSAPHTSSRLLADSIVRPETAIGSSSYRASHLGPVFEEVDGLSAAPRAENVDRGYIQGETATARKVRLSSRHTFGTLHEEIRSTNVIPESASLLLPPRTSEDRRAAAHQEALEALISGAPWTAAPGSPSYRASASAYSAGLVRPVSAYSFRSFTSERAASPPPPVQHNPAAVRTHHYQHSGSSGKRRRYVGERGQNDSIDSSMDQTFRESIFSDLSCIESNNTNGSFDTPTPMVRKAQPARRFEGADIVECASPRTSSEARRGSRSREGQEITNVIGRDEGSIAGRISQASINMARPPIEVPPTFAARNNSFRSAAKTQSVPRQAQADVNEGASVLLLGERRRTELLAVEEDNDFDLNSSPHSDIERNDEFDELFPGLKPEAGANDDPDSTRIGNIRFPPLPPDRKSSKKPAAKLVATRDLNTESEAPFRQRLQETEQELNSTQISEQQHGIRSTTLSRKQRFEQLRKALERPDAQPSDLLWERRLSISSNGSADSGLAVQPRRHLAHDQILFLDPVTPITPKNLKPATTKATLKLSDILTVANVAPSSPYSTYQPRLPSVPFSISTEETSATVVQTSSLAMQEEYHEPTTPPGSHPYSASITSHFSDADADRSPVYNVSLVPPKRAKPSLVRRFSSASYSQGLRESSLPRPKTAGKRSMTSEKNFFAGAATGAATTPQRFPVLGSGSNNDADVVITEQDVREKSAFKMTRSQIFEKYEALREKQTRDMERRLRRLEDTEDHWLASMLPLLTDLNKIITRLHLNDEEGQVRDAIEAACGSGGPSHDSGPRFPVRRQPWSTRSGVVEGTQPQLPPPPHHSSQFYYGHHERNDWNTEDMYRRIPERHRPFHFEQRPTSKSNPHSGHHSQIRKAARRNRWSTPTVPTILNYDLGKPSASDLPFRDRVSAGSASAIDQENAWSSAMSVPDSRTQSIQGPRLFRDIELMAPRDVPEHSFSSSLKDMLSSSCSFPSGAGSDAGSDAAGEGVGESSAPAPDDIMTTGTLMDESLEMTWPRRPSFDSISSLETYDGTSSGSCEVPVSLQRRYFHHHHYHHYDQQRDYDEGYEEEEDGHEGEMGNSHQLNDNDDDGYRGYDDDRHSLAAPCCASSTPSVEGIEPLMRELQAAGSRLSGESHGYEEIGDDEVRKMRQRPGPRAVVNFRAFN
ncbi:hypothetical protein BD289DRAFT_219257 [Coniella lustricola]|uniref:Uncharacterized protein n=1 Tax=Coniella lustricola TaxID=2025994 RepID=A0A2T3ALI7_9PEZI|nr:hypothetical protein BD289DRAFT_219257 [Coniella lustricola]